MEFLENQHDLSEKHPVRIDAKGDGESEERMEKTNVPQEGSISVRKHTYKQTSHNAGAFLIKHM